MSADTQHVTQEQIDAVITTITDKLGGLFVTPANIEPILYEIVSIDPALVSIATNIWQFVERMHQQQGVTLTTVAMQTAMIEELGKQRDLAVQEAHDEGLEIGMEIGYEEMEMYAANNFAQGVADNRIDGLTEIQIDAFADIFYEGRLDDKAKQMLRDLIFYVWEKAEADMSEVDF